MDTVILPESFNVQRCAIPPYPIPAPSSASFLARNAFRYALRFHVRYKTTISAIPLIAPNIPKPMGNTWIDWPGTTNADVEALGACSAAAAMVAAALLAEVAVTETRETPPADTAGAPAATSFDPSALAVDVAEAEAAESEVSVADAVAVADADTSETPPSTETAPPLPAAAVVELEVPVVSVDEEVELVLSVVEEDDESVPVLAVPLLVVVVPELFASPSARVQVFTS